MSKADYHALGLDLGAGVDAARAAFRKLALKLHPDKNPAPDAQEKYLEKAKAYEAILRAGDRAAEADALLEDPFADIFGAGWARSLAEGRADPTAMLEAGRVRAAAELGVSAAGGGGPPMGDLAADLGLDGETLAALMAGANLGGDDADDAGGNPFKEFFDSLPASERPRMMELFEKTFPAFLAQEMEGTQLEAENELFRRAVETQALPQQQHSSARAAPHAAIEEKVELLNAEAVEHFQADRFAAAAASLTRALTLDPAGSPALYGNRSLAYEKCERYEEALDDAERSLRCDPMYCPAYERKARALLGLRRPAEALGAVRRGLVLAPDHGALLELEERAECESDKAKLDIVRAGKQQIVDWDEADRPQELLR